MGRGLVPELHDALKLTVLQHDFSDFNYEKFSENIPDTRTWQGILQHHCSERFPDFPTDRETFLLHMADGIASNFSRHGYAEKGVDFVLHKLWNPNAVREDKRLKGDHEIRSLLGFLKTDPTFEEFNNKYGDILRTRVEDASAGKNITSLYVHLVLTGKFYRFFMKSNILKIGDNEIIPDVQKVRELTKRKSETWRIYLARCKFHFNQKPVRARDLNVFGLLEETISQIEKDYNDNILFSTSDEILIYYDNKSTLEKISSIAMKNNLWISVIEDNKPLEEMKADPSKMQPRSYNFYGSLPSLIYPPICEICQMQPADKIWPSDYLKQFGEDPEIVEKGAEDLCDTCFSVRSRKSRLRKLKDWQNVNVAWVKLSLDYGLLTAVLQQLYSTYLKKTESTDKVEVRFSLVYEFQQDYDEFLRTFQDGLLEAYGNDRVETILKDMVCIKIERQSEVFKILNLLNDKLNYFFPEFKKFTEGPIRTSIVCCNSNFPFFEVWRDIESQVADLRISLVGHGRIDTSNNYLDQILVAREGHYKKGALYKLAEISKLSEKLAEIKFNDRSEKGDFRSYETLKRNLLPIGMDFQSILTFTKLIGD